MATDGTAGRTTRTSQGGGTVNKTVKRSMVGGLVGAALLLGGLVGMSAQEDGSVASLPGKTLDSAPYRLSPPNEQDVDGSGRALPVITRPYLLSPPNELDPQGDAADVRTSIQQTAYRLSPPNEMNPNGPSRSMDTAAHCRRAGSAASG